MQQRSDKTRLEALRQKAIKEAASYNASLNRERREDRRAYFDVQTFVSDFLLFLFLTVLIIMWQFSA